MQPIVFAAVLFSAFFQAGWNFYAKNSRANKIALLSVGWFLFSVSCLPLVIFALPNLKLDSLGLRCVVASGLIHAAYLYFLGWAYSVGEISVVYPVSRGLGIAGTTLGALGFGFHTLSAVGFMGIASVVGGTILIGLKEIPQQERRKAFLLAGFVAVTVTSYSLVDSIGAKHVHPLFYVVIINLIASLATFPYLFFKLRQEARTVWSSHKAEAFLVAFAGCFAYSVILWAYSNAPVSYVAALREFSVVIAALLGVVLLKENLYKRKIAGILLILLGVVFIKLT